MRKINAKNELLKRSYRTYLIEADRKSETSALQALKALERFESSLNYADLASFKKEHAIEFKKKLAAGGGGKKPLSVSTILSTAKALQKFYRWLAFQPGYKTKIKIGDIDYFNLQERDVRAFTSKPQKTYASVEQYKHALFAMPSATEFERRDRALFAGIRDAALVSLRIKHINIDKNEVHQDPREVATKNRKLIYTYFFPVGDDVKFIFLEWLDHLKTTKMWEPNAPLFPKSANKHDKDKGFVQTLVPEFWADASYVRTLFKRTFNAVELPYYNPHTVRDTLVQLGEQTCTTPEMWKAWSQNLGHENVQTTWASYGAVALDRQAEIIKNPSTKKSNDEKLEQLLNWATKQDGFSLE
ncbi:MAG: site-specific integrase [Alphaproteobacteria bacterium]